MKRILLLIAVILPLFLSARQNNEAVINEISVAVSKISTLQCDFEQTKHLKMLNDKLVSQGKMSYQQSDKLRWEYNSPYTYTFILNGTKVYLTKDSRSDVIDIKQNKMFKEIARIMMNSVVGKCLTDTKEFQVSIADSKSEWVATLLPQKKTMKQMFTKIILRFSKQESMIKQVEMYEKNGDYTIITLKNTVVNKPVNANAFKN